MSDAYQPIYDAVRSRIGGANVGDIVHDVIAGSFDFSGTKALIHEAVCVVRDEQLRPSVLYRPRISRDGSVWYALYGENLQEGVVGFGDSPASAMLAFDAAWIRPILKEEK